MEVLTPAEMAQADRNAERAGIATWQLMQAAGEAVASEALRRFPRVGRIAVLCGPGNNGGDGYVAAACLLSDSGLPVEVWQSSEPRPESNAARAAGEWVGAVGELENFRRSLICWSLMRFMARAWHANSKARIGGLWSG